MNLVFLFISFCLGIDEKQERRQGGKGERRKGRLQVGDRHEEPFLCYKNLPGNKASCVS